MTNAGAPVLTQRRLTHNPPPQGSRMAVAWRRRPVLRTDKCPQAFAFQYLPFPDPPSPFHSFEEQKIKIKTKWAAVLGGEGGQAIPGKRPGGDRRRKAAGAVLPGRGRFSPIGRGSGASRSQRGRGEVRPGAGVPTHQIWNLSRGPVAYCIFNLLPGTPPKLAEASLRTTADAATSRSSRSLILNEPATSTALTLRPQAARSRAGAGNWSPPRKRDPPRSTREAAMRMRIPAPAQAVRGRTDPFYCPDPPCWVCAGDPGMEWEE